MIPRDQVDTTRICARLGPNQFKQLRLIPHPRHVFVPANYRNTFFNPFFIVIMQLQFASLFALLAGPVAVMACEGECIVGITDAFLGNYSSPVLSVLYDTVSRSSHLCYGPPD